MISTQKRATRRSPPTGQIQSIEIIRGFSILAVLCGHSLLIPFAGKSGLFWSLFIRFARNGAYGVTTFFVVSGFLISRLIDGQEQRMFRPEIPRFYIRRLSRILPMLLIVCALGYTVYTYGDDRMGALGVTFKDPKATFDGWFWVSILLFFFNWRRILNEPSSQGYGLNWDVLWSLAIEEQFYAGYPFFLRWLRTPKRLVRFLICMILLGIIYRLVACMLAPQSFLWGFTGSFAAFDQIAIGVLMYIFRREQWLRRASVRQRDILFITGLLIAAGTYSLTFAGNAHHRIFGPTLLATGVAIVLLVGLDRPVFDIRIWQPLKILGKASYEAYLLHGAALYVIWPYAIEKPWGLTVFFYISSVTIVASIVHIYIEEPLKGRLVTVISKWFSASRHSLDTRDHQP